MAVAAFAHTFFQAPFTAYALSTAQRLGYQLDVSQLSAAAELDRLYRELVETEKGGRSLLRRFQRSQPLRGVYLWGGVGRGKSFLLDAFFDAVPISRKQRSHFHRFMLAVHHRLRDLQGESNPLRLVGREVAERTRLICLDEFQVTDIGDAMIMRNLLQSLFEHGVALVATSNLQPDALYEHGLQRAQFLPAIDLLKQRMILVDVDGGIDYRLAVLEKAGVFHAPAGAAAEEAMAATFEDLAGEPGTKSEAIEIEGRAIASRRVGQGVAWFDFAALCAGPRGQADYIELSRRFHTILISGVPRFVRANADERRRFTWLVDEFYDRRVKVVLSAEAALTELFTEAGHGPEVERTLSRLVEMQSRRFLSEAHLS